MCEEIHNGVGNALCSTINALCNNENNYSRNKMYLDKKREEWEYMIKVVLNLHESKKTYMPNNKTKLFYYEFLRNDKKQQQQKDT